MLPRMVRPNPVLPLPRDVYDVHVMSRNRGIDQLEADETAMAVDEIHRTGLNMMLHSHFDKRNARVGRTQRYLDGYQVAVRRGYGVGSAGVLRIDADEASPLGNANELCRILANVERIVRCSVRVVVKLDRIDSDHRSLPPPLSPCRHMLVVRIPAMAPNSARLYTG